MRRLVGYTGAAAALLLLILAQTPESANVLLSPTHGRAARRLASAVTTARIPIERTVSQNDSGWKAASRVGNPGSSRFPDPMTSTADAPFTTGLRVLGSVESDTFPNVPPLGTSSWEAGWHLGTQDGGVLGPLSSYRDQHGRNPATGGENSRDEFEADVATHQLSRQSFENFYTALFYPTNDGMDHSSETGDSVRTQVQKPASAVPEGNPFGEAINALKKDTAHDPLTATSTSAGSTPQNQNGSSGSQVDSKEQRTPPQPTPPPTQPPTGTPATQSGRQGKPTPQLSVPGGIKSLTFVGDLDSTGVGVIYPGFHLQADQFEIPRLGVINLKLAMIADPALAMLSIVVDDLNGDGWADIAMVSKFESFLLVWMGSPGGEFTYVGASILPAGGISVTAGDFNADGKQDLAVLQGINGQKVDIFLGDGTGAFRFAATLQLPNSAEMLVAGEIDSDSGLDLIATNLDTFRASVLLSSMAGLLFRPSTLSFINFPTAQLVTDLSFDSRPDQVFLFQYGTQLSLVLNPAKQLVVRNIANVNLRYPVVLVLGDLFGEGRNDLGVASLPR